MCLSLILWDRILAMKPSILRQNTGRKSKQIMAADDNISHFNSHSSLQVMRLQRLPHLTMSSLDPEAETPPKFFVNLSHSVCVHPELTLSWLWATDILDRLPTAFSFSQQSELNCHQPRDDCINHSHSRKANKCLEHDSSNSQSSLHIDWFHLPIKCMLQEDFGPPVTAKKAPHYAIYHISYSLLW